jgi:hypothetical protein
MNNSEIDEETAVKLDKLLKVLYESEGRLPLYRALPGESIEEIERLYNILVEHGYAYPSKE